MGEVWKARDSRLSREVAIKVLPASFSNDADRLRRFEQEAKAAGLLNHPNITAVYDIGTHEGAPYVVSELLEGEPLRAALSGGRLSPRKAIDYALQMAHGLAAAHEKGIVHRDLKPENLFVTKDGRVKILDFGLAKLTHAEEGSGQQTGLQTATAGTEPGVVLGTLGYMAPEQVRGRPADVRSDIFSFGAILYEMLSGNRAFHGDSAADTMSAILREDPPELSLTNQSLPAGLERIVRHCLEKNPEQRFHSAHDLAFDLESLSGLSSPGARPVAARSGPSRRGLLVAAGLATLAAAAAASFLAGRRAERLSAPAGPSFSQLTFRQQPIFRARFSPDGKTIVFSAATKGNTPEIFSLRPDYPGATARGLPGVHLLAISSKGELAVLTRARYIGHNLFEGTLARMPLEGAAPREILEGVREADWSPDGNELAVIRDVNGKDRLEFPAGKVLCEASGYLSDLRFSPKGDRIAFFEHAIKYDDRGLVAVVDLSGKKTVLSEGYWGEEGLAWSPNGEEVLFSAGTAYNNFKIYAVTLSGRRRVASDSAGGLTIHDAGGGGRWLVTRDDFFRKMFVLPLGEKDEKELSWLDLSEPSALSADGKTLLFTEESGSVGVNYAVCLRGTDGSAVVRLGEGTAQDLSPDGKWALAVVPSSPHQLVLYPTGAGEKRRLESGGLVSYRAAQFFPDGRRLLVCGAETGRAVRCYIQEIAGGKPRPLTPEGMSQGYVSPDGASILVRSGGGALLLFPAAGGEPRSVPGTTPEDRVLRWGADGRSLILYSGSQVPVRSERLDLATGRREPLRTFGNSETAGALRIGTFAVNNDGKSYAYSYGYQLSHLFVVEGAR
jgi:serine/threonine protein kinase/dipeptidyl aminopeptidase/acylaminoacyl peptidase